MPQQVGEEERTRIQFSAFYEKYNEKIILYLRRKCATVQDAEDLASQVFEYCYRHFAEYDSVKASEISWVYMIARSRLKNYYRSRKVTVNLDEIENYIVSDSSELDRALMLDDLRNRLADALEELSETDRHIVILRYFKRKDAEYISERLGISPGAVRTRLSRALRKLQSKLSDVL